MFYYNLEFIYCKIDVVVTYTLMVERVEEMKTSTKRFEVIGNCEIMQKQVR
jgi:hypothetical protein